MDAESIQWRIHYLEREIRDLKKELARKLASRPITFNRWLRTNEARSVLYDALVEPISTYEGSRHASNQKCLVTTTFDFKEGHNPILMRGSRLVVTKGDTSLGRSLWASRLFWRAIRMQRRSAFTFDSWVSYARELERMVYKHMDRARMASGIKEDHLFSWKSPSAIGLDTVSPKFLLHGKVFHVKSSLEDPDENYRDVTNRAKMILSQSKLISKLERIDK